MSREPTTCVVSAPLKGRPRHTSLATRCDGSVARCVGHTSHPHLITFEDGRRQTLTLTRPESSRRARLKLACAPGIAASAWRSIRVSVRDSKIDSRAGSGGASRHLMALQIRISRADASPPPFDVRASEFASAATQPNRREKSALGGISPQRLPHGHPYAPGSPSTAAGARQQTSRGFSFRARSRLSGLAPHPTAFIHFARGMCAGDSSGPWSSRCRSFFEIRPATRWSGSFPLASTDGRRVDEHST